MSKIDPIKMLFEDIPDSVRREDYQALDNWASEQGMAQDEVARFLLAFMAALFTKLGTSDITLARFVVRCAQMARDEMEARSK